MIKSAQRGFTLIELVVVIVILGILAAFAVPRFINLEQQARVATIRALEGSVRSASALAHAMSLATGLPTGDVMMEGTAVAVVNGYPTRASIADALASHAGFGYNPATGVFSLTGAVNCTVTYTAATIDANLVVTPPQIDLNQTCQ